MLCRNKIINTKPFMKYNRVYYKIILQQTRKKKSVIKCDVDCSIYYKNQQRSKFNTRTILSSILQ